MFIFYIDGLQTQRLLGINNPKYKQIKMLDQRINSFLLNDKSGNIFINKVPFMKME